MFYEYSQNNSGGHFQMDKTIAHFMIIEAASADAANEIAERIGIYFDGIADEIDCECCGDRWHEAVGAGYQVPSIYGRPATDYDTRYGAGPTKLRCMWTPEGKPYAYIHYQDGRRASLINGSPNEPVKVLIDPA